MAHEPDRPHESLPFDPDLLDERLGGAKPVTGRLARRPEAATLAAIALGGALGASARLGVANLISVRAGGFPWATFGTNVSGSFVLGFVLVLLIERFPPSRYLRAFVATGFLGAYTTYSTFAVGADLLVKNGHSALAVAYALGSLLAGFSAVWAGICGARAIPLSRSATATGASDTPLR
ncbi:MAG: fluoride efflux transporter FluC [Acidimicrobiales bacterium]